MSTNVVWHASQVTRPQREALQGHRACVLWFTGLSGAGKSTLAGDVERELLGLGFRTLLLDGDNMRHGLNADLGFTDADRTENIRRLAEVAKVACNAGLVTLVAAITPTRAQRALARQIAGTDDFVEIHVDCDLAVCEQRDPKGLYKRARQSQLSDFTGISAGYEIPVAPDLVVNTSAAGRDAAAGLVIQQTLKLLSTDS